MQKIILFVDDDIAVLKGLKDQFREEFGYQFTYELAQSGEEGLEILSNMHTASVKDENLLLLVISDWLMPGLKGDQFLIEANKRFPQAKKILLTGQADERAIHNARENANLDKFISKPWNPQDLFQMVRSAVND